MSNPLSTLKRSGIVTTAARVAMVIALLAATWVVSVGTAAPTRAATSEPCDIYGTAGTACVAAYSTVRALYGSYNGNLYQVKRASDGTTTNIGLLAAGGYANAATQNSFCASTTCTITEIYDQSPKGNNLTIEGPGAAGGQDFGANASALPLVVGGHSVYGVLIGGQTGYRYAGGVGNGMATNGQPEGMYAVVGGTNVDDICCFDFGNVESTETDTGAGHMDALNFSVMCGQSPCQSPGPWVQADLENGVFHGAASLVNSSIGNPARFVTALLANDGQANYELRGGNATGGSLITFYDGPLPSGYAPMHQEGGIVLGTGGDNSNTGVGSFLEGVITSGFPSDSADNSVQANIVTAGYSQNSGAGPGGTIVGPGSMCIAPAGDDTASDGTPVILTACNSYAADQHWLHNTDNSLQTLGRCLDIIGNGTTAGTKVQLWDCNGVGGQGWVVQSNGSLENPQSGLCLDDPSGNTTDGEQLQVWTCNSASSQLFSVNGGGTITLPGGQCVDTAGLDNPANGEAEQVFSCQKYAADQHWYHNTNGSLSTLGNWQLTGSWCLDIVGNGTAPGTKVDLYQCNGVGGQNWQHQANGTLKNPQSGLCLDDPGGNTNNGTQFVINTCTSASEEQFTLHS